VVTAGPPIARGYVQQNVDTGDLTRHETYYEETHGCGAGNDSNSGEERDDD
jgi:hypothetical protein